MEHFGVLKNLNVLHEPFYQSKMKRDTQRICDKRIACRQAKSKVLSHGLYILLLVFKESWVDISIDFVLDLPR